MLPGHRRSEVNFSRARAEMSSFRRIGCGPDWPSRHSHPPFRWEKSRETALWWWVILVAVNRSISPPRCLRPTGPRWRLPIPNTFPPDDTRDRPLSRLDGGGRWNPVWFRPATSGRRFDWLKWAKRMRVLSIKATCLRRRQSESSRCFPPVCTSRSFTRSSCSKSVPR